MGLLMAVFFISLFWGIQGPLFDWDEGAFSEASREMLTGGDYITTYMNGDVRFAKPVLIYWFQVASMKVFGVNTFAVRLPSVLFVAVWATATFAFASRLLGGAGGFFSTFFLITALQISVVGRAAISDALLNMNIALSMFGIFLYYRTESVRFARLALAAIALGTLTKGPIAILIPGFTSLVFFFWKGKIKLWARGVFDPLGLLIFVGLTIPWYVLQYMDQGYAFIEGFFLKHNVGRFTSAMEGHGGGPWYYIPVVIAGFLPFTSILFRVFRDAKDDFKKDDFTGFGLIWFVFVFVFFSLSGTKLPHYVIYGYAPLFILMAGVLPRIKNDLLLFLPPILFVGVLFFLPEILGMARASAKPDTFSAHVLEGAMGVAGPIYRGSAGLVLILLILFAFKKPLDRELRLVLTGFLFIGFVNLQLLPIAEEILQSPVVEAARVAKERNLKVSVWRIYWPSFIFYTGSLTPMKIPETGDVLLMKTAELKYIGEYNTYYQKNGLSLIEVTSMTEEDYKRMMMR